MPRTAHALLALAATSALLCGCLSEAPELVEKQTPGQTSDQPSPQPEPAPGPPIRTITYKGKQFTVCTVDLNKFDIELFWRDDQKQAFGGFRALNDWLQARGRRLVFAMNAGMFQENLAPCGLYVENGEQLHGLNLADGSSNFCMKPNGVFAITKEGAKVIESSTYPAIKDETILATQSGPMLVINGELHPKFGPDSTSRLRRNGVGVVDPHTVVFALAASPVNFHEFASFFRDDLHCNNALYLDGAISSLYSPALGRCDELSPLGPIIGVTAGG